MGRKVTRRRFLRDAICGIFGALSLPTCKQALTYFKDPVIEQIDFDLLDWYVYYDPLDNGWEARILIRPQCEWTKTFLISIPTDGDEMSKVLTRLHIAVERFWIEELNQKPIEAFGRWDAKWHTVMKNGVTIDRHYLVSDDHYPNIDNLAPFPTSSQSAECQSSQNKILQQPEPNWKALLREIKETLTTQEQKDINYRRL